MRARFVYESVNFERGRDPKEAMGLGDAELAKWVNETNPILNKLGYELYSTDVDEILEWLRTHRYGIGQYEYLSTYPESVKALWVQKDDEHYVIMDMNTHYKTWGFRVINSGISIHRTPGKVVGGSDESLNHNWKAELEYSAGYFVKESVNFERGKEPKRSMGIGKYAPRQVSLKDFNGDTVTIEIRDDTFKVNDLEVRLEFKETDEHETVDVYVDGEKSDLRAFKMEPFDYEFKEQGQFAKPGFTGYGQPIAKDKEDLARLKDESSYWYVNSGDYTRTDKDPFSAVAQLIAFTY